MPRVPPTPGRFLSRPLSTVRGLAPVILSLLLTPSASGWAQPAALRPAAPAMLGDSDVFVKKGCARCHRVRGIGDGTAGPDLGRIGSGTGFFEIAAAMWNHLPRMRAKMLEQGVEWPLLTPQELESVIAFLFAAQYQDAPGDPAAGARLFVSKGCEQCHAVGGKGSPTGPPLDELKRSRSPVVVAAAMWNHASSMGEAMEAAGVARPTLAGAEFADIVAYILAAGSGPQREPAPVVVGAPERGKRLFADKGCARCHAVGGKRSGRAPSLGPRASRATVTELAGLLWNHGPARTASPTPGVAAPRISGQEMADITAYLHASYYFDPSRGDARNGQRLIRSKGCLRCHSVYHTGGGLAPDFATSNVVSTQLGQLAAMWNRGRLMENEARRRGFALPTLTARELADITRYLAGLGSGAPKP
jgi:mono/diheme cytochrome c family protein